MKKKTMALLCTLCMTMGVLAGCGSTDAGNTSAEAESSVESSTVQASSEAASSEASTAASSTAASETTEAGKQAILVVSFGTSYNDSRDITIGAIENAITEAFPAYEVRRAFTSQIIIDKLKERDGLEIDNVTEALDRAVEDGITTLVVQPTHLMSGYEYTDLIDELSNYTDKFDQIAVGAPLLTSEEDYDAVVTAITGVTEEFADGETAICFMGHGTEADSNTVYATLQDKLTDADYTDYYVGTVEAEPSVEDVLAAVDAAGKYKKVVLRPLMVVAGDHANNDMAGDEDDSWKSVFEKAGYEVTCEVHGLGEVEAIQQIYVDHTQAAVDSLAK